MSSMRWILRRGRGIDSALILVVIPSYTHTFTSRHGIRSDMAPGQSWYDVAGAQRDSCRTPMPTRSLRYREAA